MLTVMFGFEASGKYEQAQSVVEMVFGDAFDGGDFRLSE